MSSGQLGPEDPDRILTGGEPGDPPPADRGRLTPKGLQHGGADPAIDDKQNVRSLPRDDLTERVGAGPPSDQGPAVSGEQIVIARIERDKRRVRHDVSWHSRGDRLADRLAHSLLGWDLRPQLAAMPAPTRSTARSPRPRP